MHIRSGHEFVSECMSVFTGQRSADHQISHMGQS